MIDKSAYLRGSLASVGILIDPPTEPAMPVTIAPPPVVDRVAIRAILKQAGAAPHHLDWLVESCPSEEAARGYTPPAYVRRRST